MLIMGDTYGFYQLVLRKHACRAYQNCKLLCSTVPWLYSPGGDPGTLARFLMVVQFRGVLWTVLILRSGCCRAV
uniref:Secreted protein n=1 Tax=Steinernema glaseri TaxID=37863 RepID=A0A1I7YZ65_9BILA